MELTRIDLADVRPDPNNPRSDFGDLEALAASFELNPAAPGEPLQPIVTVRDANVYRIVDGERRYRAMAKRGTESCWSNVCESMDEANSVVQMLATDDKQALTEEERSRGVQQMLILGVPEATVDRTARTKGAARRIRQAMGAASEPKPMTLDWLLAIADAQDEGDQDAVEALESADAGSWQRVAHEHDFKRKARRECDNMASAARKMGFSILEEKPADGELGQRRWLGAADDEDLRDAYARGYRHLLVQPSDYGAVAHAQAWMDPGCAEEEPEEDPESEAARAHLEQVQAMIEEAEGSAYKWIGGELAVGHVPAPVAGWFDEVFPESFINESLEHFEEASGVEVVEEGSHPICLVAIMLAKCWPDPWPVEVGVGRNPEAPSWTRSSMRKWLGFYRMLEDAGWKMPKGAAELCKAVQDALDAASAGEDDKED